MAEMALAGQYSDKGKADPDFIERVPQAYKALLAAGIEAFIEVETSSRTIKVKVQPGQREAARTALKDILPNVPRRLKMRVDANAIRRVTPAAPVLLPGDQLTIGRASVAANRDEKIVTISDDPKIASQHLQVRWDGLNKLEVKDVSSQQDAHIGTVLIGSEWMELEPGAKVQFGETTVSFQLGEPVD